MQQFERLMLFLRRHDVFIANIFVFLIACVVAFQLDRIGLNQHNFLEVWMVFLPFIVAVVARNVFLSFVFILIYLAISGHLLQLMHFSEDGPVPQRWQDKMNIQATFYVISLLSLVVYLLVAGIRKQAKDGKEKLTWFSWRQWVLLVVLDVFFRVVSFVAPFLALNFFALFIVYNAIFFSALHLVVLFAAICLAVRFGRATFASIAIAVLITNVIFVGVYVWTEVAQIKRGSATYCVGLKPDCGWIDGVVQWTGMLWLAVQTAPQILINIIPVTMMSGFKRFGNRSAP